MQLLWLLPPARPRRAIVVYALCGWLGFSFGLIEAFIQLFWWRLEHLWGSPDLWVNWNAPWLAPLVLCGVFLAFGVVIRACGSVLPRLTGALGPCVLIVVGVPSALGPIQGLHPWGVRLLAIGLAARLGRKARLDSPELAGLARRLAPWQLVVWAAIAITTGLVPLVRERAALAWIKAAPGGSPNVLLVVMDTVRSKNLSTYGYDRCTSPCLSRWAESGVRFEKARATTPFTLGTHASLFTGNWMSATSARANARLDGASRTLAEELRDRGYATGGFVGNIFYCSAHYGLDRGFLRYVDSPGNLTRRITAREVIRSCRLGAGLLTYYERKWHILKPLQRERVDAAEINRQALGWLDNLTIRGGGRPFFLFLNYFDAHAPYSLPPEAPQPYARISPEVLEGRLKEIQRAQDERAGSSGRGGGGGDAPLALTEEERRTYADLQNAYDDGIAWIDRQLDELLKELDRRGQLDNTLVVITSDHGEMLGEHGFIGHGKTLHPEVLDVPLVIKGTRAMGVPAGLVVRDAVSLRDVPATILDLVGGGNLGAWPGPLPGRSLRRYWSPERGAGERGPVISELEHMHWMARDWRTPSAWGPMWVLVDGRWCYHRQNHEDRGRVESLFDLEEDPREEVDLAGSSRHGVAVDRLSKKLESEIPGAARSAD